MKNIWNIGIKLKIGVGFSFILIVLIGVQYGLNKSISNVINSQRDIINSTKLSTEIESIKSSVCFFESKMKEYILTGNDTLLNNNDKYLSAIVLKFKNLNNLSPNQEQIAAIDTLVSLLNSEIQFVNEIIFQYSVEPQQAIALVKLGKGKTLMTQIIHEFEKINTIEQQKFAEIIRNNNRNSATVELMDTSAYIFAFLLVLICTLILYKDINKRGKLEKKLVIAQKKAEHAAVIKEQFMANMSHEIRTPMNAIIGFNERLSKTKLNDEQKDYVLAVQSSGENLLAIVNDILDFSKLEAGMVRIEQIHFNLSEVLHSVYALFFIQVKEKNVHLQLEIAEKVPELVIGDPTRLTQILTNLIGNALKFTTEGNINIIVSLLKENDHDVFIRFKVKDTGIGISEEKISEIFDRFTQEKSDTSRIYGGTGLGLSIVKKLVELQNGTITVNSQKDIGSIFTFIIPYKKVTASNLPINSKQSNVAYIKNKGKILVVEDNILNQKLAEYILADTGFEFEISSNGKLALEKLKKNAYDLILMDIQMPEMNGYETTEYIRKKLKLDIPIIAMTAHVLPDEKEKCLRFGMNDYISKPMKEDNLLELISKNISIHVEH